jgi:saccharopepsin
MINKGLLDAPVFSFRLGASEQDGGEAIFGGIDDSAYTGKISYAPVRRKAYWEVELESVSFGDDILELENTGAAIDTGLFPLLHCLLRYHVHVTSCRYIPHCVAHRYRGDA